MGAGLQYFINQWNGLDCTYQDSFMTPLKLN